MVLLTLMLLLRSLIAPLYLVGSRVVSYFAALGIGSWCSSTVPPTAALTVPPLAFVVAVGAITTCCSHRCCATSRRTAAAYGIIRTLSSTGGVITAAGLIFAASMWGLLFSSIGTVVQGGFVIGAGILLDTFVVRTITVPAIATLVGKANPLVAITSDSAGEQPGMKKLLAAATVVPTVSCMGPSGLGVAGADEPAPRAGCRDRHPDAARHTGQGLRLGGAHVLGIPARSTSCRTGADWFLGPDRQIVDYPGSVGCGPRPRLSGCSRYRQAGRRFPPASGWTGRASASRWTWRGQRHPRHPGRRSRHGDRVVRGRHGAQRGEELAGQRSSRRCRISCSFATFGDQVLKR